jgi:hypothetical protein
MAKRVRRLFRGGRVVDLGGGHGMLAHLMLLLDDSSPSAMVIDLTIPPSSARLHEALVRAWPRLSGRVSFVEAELRLWHAERSRDRPRDRRQGAGRGPAVLSRLRDV